MSSRSRSKDPLIKFNNIFGLQNRGNLYANTVLRPIEKYTIEPKMTGVMIVEGISAMTFPKK